MQATDIILAGVMGMNLSDVNHAVFIAETTKDISDMDDFITYCRENKNKIEYATKTERLDTLAIRYLKQQEDIILGAKFKQAEKYAIALSKKVKECRTFVEDNYIGFENVGTAGAKHFTADELRMLKMIGSTNIVIEYSKVNRLSQVIYDNYSKAIRAKEKQVVIENRKQAKKLDLKINRF